MDNKMADNTIYEYVKQELLGTDRSAEFKENCTKCAERIPYFEEKEKELKAFFEKYDFGEEGKNIIATAHDRIRANQANIGMWEYYKKVMDLLSGSNDNDAKKAYNAGRSDYKGMNPYYEGMLDIYFPLQEFSAKADAFKPSEPASLKAKYDDLLTLAKRLPEYVTFLCTMDIVRNYYYEMNTLLIKTIMGPDKTATPAQQLKNWGKAKAKWKKVDLISEMDRAFDRSIKGFRESDFRAQYDTKMLDAIDLIAQDEQKDMKKIRDSVKAVLNFQ